MARDPTRPNAGSNNSPGAGFRVSHGCVSVASLNELSLHFGNLIWVFILPWKCLAVLIQLLTLLFNVNFTSKNHRLWDFLPLISSVTREDSWPKLKSHAEREMVFSLFTMSNKQNFLFCFYLFCIVFEAGSHCDSDCPGTPCLDQACLKLTDLSACLCLHLYLCLPGELSLKLWTTTPSFKLFKDDDTNDRDESSPVNRWALCARSGIMQLREAIQTRQVVPHTIHRNRISQAWGCALHRKMRTTSTQASTWLRYNFSHTAST